MMEPRSKAVYLHRCDIDYGVDSLYSVFEEKRSVLVCGCAYPGGGSRSRSGAACKRALEIGVDCFLERPSSSDVAVETIAGFINDEICGMQDKEKSFHTSLAMLYIFKGKTRVYVAGNAEVMFFENGEYKNIWSGGGNLLGSNARPEMIFSDEFELTEDARFVMVTAADSSAAEEIVAIFNESKGEETEDNEGFVKDYHCSYVNLFLPKREKRGFFR